jgi:hypothetical protein
VLDNNRDSFSESTFHDHHSFPVPLNQPVTTTFRSSLAPFAPCLSGVQGDEKVAPLFLMMAGSITCHHQLSSSQITCRHRQLLNLHRTAIAIGNAGLSRPLISAGIVTSQAMAATNAAMSSEVMLCGSQPRWKQPLRGRHVRKIVSESMARICSFHTDRSTGSDAAVPAQELRNS